MGRTSTDVKRRYNEKVYRHLNVQIPTELFEAFKEKCERLGVPQRQVIIEAVEKFVRTE